MVICTDLDEVCNNLCSVVIKFYNEDTGENLTLDDIKEYDISAAFKPEYRGRILQYFNHPRFISMLEWNIKWLIPLMHSTQHSLYFVTATHPKNIFEKCEYLIQAIKESDTMWGTELIKDYVYGHLITTSNKQMIKKDVLIDDCIDNLDLNDTNVFNILVSKPWNRKWANLYNATHLDRQRIIICDSVDDIPEVINHIHKQIERR